MIDAERMLGSLVRNAMGGSKRGRRRRGRRSGGGLGRGLLGMGALGVAVAAFEHFTKGEAEDKFSGAAAPVPAAPAAASALPPVPTPVTGSLAPPTLPPLPSASADQGEALTLVRAMIAAAHADHHLDEDERARILGAVDDAELSDEERDFISGELDTPVSIAVLAASAASPDAARQIYAASLIAIEVDSDAERNHLAKLADALGLDRAAVAELEELL